VLPGCANIFAARFSLRSGSDDDSHDDPRGIEPEIMELTRVSGEAARGLCKRPASLDEHEEFNSSDS
jgi:hypothetical protein